jgi:hypothetical protein
MLSQIAEVARVFILCMRSTRREHARCSIQNINQNFGNYGEEFSAPASITGRGMIGFDATSM